MIHEGEEDTNQKDSRQKLTKNEKRYEMIVWCNCKKTLVIRPGMLCVFEKKLRKDDDVLTYRSGIIEIIVLYSFEHKTKVTQENLLR